MLGVLDGREAQDRCQCLRGTGTSEVLVTLSIRFSRNPVIVDIDRVGSFGMGGWQQL